jgi:uncharacterized membrane protein YccC
MDRRPMNRWPGIDEWLFAVKTFAAAMAALFIAMSIGLDRPYWAMATVYIVSQPLTGALRSKAFYRLVGTVIGATATVVLVPNLVSAPELLSAALALWIGLCLYLALLDRTPRSYLFMLAGYTTALIGFPAVTTPDTIWDTALTRVEEISLGIICSTVIGTLVFPRALGPTLSTRILAWVADASAWTEQVLGGSADSPGGSDAGLGANVRLAADAVELRMLASQLAYDTSVWQTATRWVAEMQLRMVLLLPVLASIADRMAALRTGGGITPELEGLLADLKIWVRAGAPPPRSEADRMRAAIVRLEADTDPHAGWNAVMRGSLLRRLAELVDLRQDLRDLRRHIGVGGGRLDRPLAVRTAEPARMHRDHGLALLSGLAAALTTLVLCAVWIGLGWEAGSGAASFGAMACCLFAAQNDPTKGLKSFLVSTVLSVLAVGVGLFGILPAVHDFETLALVLAAFFVPVSVLTAIPATQQIGAGLSFLTATLLSLQNTYTADFVTYANSGIAAVLGIASATIMTGVMRTTGADWSVRRLLRASWRDLAAIPRSHTPRERNALSGLLLDRLGLLVPRLAAGTGGELTAVSALTDLRVGINMADLQNLRDSMPLPIRAAVDDVLLGAARHFAAQVAAGTALPPAFALLRTIDRALDATIDMPTAGIPRIRARDLLLQLVGIRRSLFADAAPYEPVPPEVASPDAASPAAAPPNSFPPDAVPDAAPVRAAARRAEAAR